MEGLSGFQMFYFIVGGCIVAIFGALIIFAVLAVAVIWQEAKKKNDKRNTQ